jgi:hypothetical protein
LPAKFLFFGRFYGPQICSDDKRLDEEAYVLWRLAVNNSENFLLCPVHGEPCRAALLGLR